MKFRLVLALATLVIVALTVLRSDDPMDAPIKAPPNGTPTDRRVALLRGDDVADVDVAPVDAEGVIGAVEWHVVDVETGAPIASAVVVGPAEAGTRQTSRSRTDTNGIARLRPGARGDVVGVFASGFVSKIVSETSKSQTVAMTRGRTISGDVIDESGHPVGGARVVATYSRNRSSWPVASESYLLGPSGHGAIATTDESGRFELRGLRDDVSYRVRASKAGYLESDHKNAGPLVAAGSSINLTLHSTLEFDLYVVDSRTRAPILSASAFHASELPGVGGFAYYEPRSRLLGIHKELEPGMFRVRFWRTGGPMPNGMFATAWAPGYSPWRGEVKFPVDGQSRVEIALDATQSEPPVAVQFVVPGGAPPFEGELFVYYRRKEDPVQGMLPSTARVRFLSGKAQRALALVPGTYYGTLKGAGAEGIWWFAAGKHQFEVPPGRERVEIPLRLDGSLLALSVQDSEGVAVRGYDLEVKYQVGSAGGRVSGWDVPGYSGALVEDGGRREQHLWVSGTACELIATVPGVGRGVVRVADLTSGERRAVSIVLDDSGIEHESPANTVGRFRRRGR